MGISYKGLWKKLIDCDLKRTDLLKLARISSTTLAQMGKDHAVSLATLDKICVALDCDIGDIVEIVPNKPIQDDENK